MTGRHRRTSSALVVAGLAWSALSLGAAPARAEAIFTATADAAAVRTSFADATVVPFLTGGGSDVTSPRSQAVGNSLGTSQALASALYPGDDLAGLTDLLGLFVPSSVPVAPPTVQFPLVVKADGTTPAPADASSPGYDLHARVQDDGTAESRATSGASPVLSPGASSTSTTQVARTPDEGVRAVAMTRTAGFSLPGLVEIGTVTTSATASRSGAGTLARSADMKVTGCSVLGLPLELRNGRFVVPVLGQSIDVNDAIRTLPVLQPLKNQGVTIEYQQAVTSPNGITAPGIRLTWVHEVPALPLPAVPLPGTVPGQPNVGPIPASVATLTYAIGFASAQASLTSFPSFGGPAPGGSFPQAADLGGVGGQAGSGSLLGSETPGLPQPAGLAAPGPSLAGAGDLVSSRPLQARSVRVATKGPDLADIYLVLVVAGLLAFGAGQFIRFQGVRTAQA